VRGKKLGYNKSKPNHNFLRCKFVLFCSNAGNVTIRFGGYWKTQEVKTKEWFQSLSTAFFNNGLLHLKWLLSSFLPFECYGH